MEMNPYELNARAKFGGLDLAASGLYTDADRHASNFGELHIKTEPSDAYTPAQRAYAAGVLEGYLTHERMLQSARNIACEVSCEEPVPQNILDFFEAQDEVRVTVGVGVGVRVRVRIRARVGVRVRVSFNP